MPEKTFKYRAEKYKAKYLAAIATKQSGGSVANIAEYNNMINLIGGDVTDTPASLSNMADSE